MRFFSVVSFMVFSLCAQGVFGATAPYRENPEPRLTKEGPTPAEPELTVIMTMNKMIGGAAGLRIILPQILPYLAGSASALVEAFSTQSASCPIPSPFGELSVEVGMCLSPFPDWLSHPSETETTFALALVGISLGNDLLGRVCCSKRVRSWLAVPIGAASTIGAAASAVSGVFPAVWEAIPWDTLWGGEGAVASPTQHLRSGEL